MTHPVVRVNNTLSPAKRDATAKTDFAVRCIDCRVSERARSIDSTTRYDFVAAGFRNGVIVSKQGWTRNKQLIRRIVACISLMTFGALLVIWLIFQHKPVWYQPVKVNDAVIQHAQLTSTEMLDEFGRQMVVGKPFNVTLKQEDVNEWLATLPHLWRDARRAIPKGLSDIAVDFSPGFVRIGAHVEKKGWRVIANLKISIAVVDTDRVIRLALMEAKGGSLEMPHSVLDRLLQDVFNQAKWQIDGNTSNTTSSYDPLANVRSLEDLRAGVVVPNDFIWPNGKRRGRISAIDITEGEIRLRIEPS